MAARKPRPMSGCADQQRRHPRPLRLRLRDTAESSSSSLTSSLSSSSLSWDVNTFPQPFLNHFCSSRGCGYVSVCSRRFRSKMPSKADLKRRLNELSAMNDQQASTIREQKVQIEALEKRAACAEEVVSKLLANAKKMKKETQSLTDAVTKSWDEHLTFKARSEEKDAFSSFQILQLRALLATYTDYDEFDADHDFLKDVDREALLAIYRKPTAHFPPQFLVPDKTYSTDDDRKCMFCGLQFTNMKGFKHCAFPACNTYYCGKWCQKQHWPVHKLWHVPADRVG